MSALKPITIIGGGLAGLTLGLALRRQDIPVAVWEADHYPRHRVCGEFISGRGQEVLARLGLQEALLAAGAVVAQTAVFFVGQASSPVRPLPAPALCMSRFHLDACLAERLRAEGGEVRERARWREPAGGAEGLVYASGRQLQAQESGWRWFGLKVHVRQVTLAADLELHCLPDAYVGLCRLYREVNVCGLFRRRVTTSEAAPPWQELLRGPPDSSLRRRLEGAVLDERSFCSIGGLSLRPQRADGCDQCRIGDALTMIPPVTGNGMSMAFEAAELAAEPLAAYSRGRLTWREAQQRVAQACDRAFARRLTWARGLQRLIFAPWVRSGLGGLLLQSDWLWRLLFARTR